MEGMSDELRVLSAEEAGRIPLEKDSHARYSMEMVRRFWRYRKERFAGRDHLFDRGRPAALRPPVFHGAHAEQNLLLSAAAAPEVNQRVIAAIPANARHRWFASMRSSQALAQSVFGNLAHHGKLALLAGLAGDEGEPAFFHAAPPREAVRFEFPIAHFGEPAPASAGILIDHGSRVVVQCALTASKAGSCSRPLLDEDDPGHCDGSYRVQGMYAERCSLSAIGVTYWDYIPRLFHWPGDRDHAPCPLASAFQIVRSVLAASVLPSGEIAADAHAVLVYDERNPAFQEEGPALQAWRAVRRGLIEPQRLRRISWQRIVARLAEDGELDWLASELNHKYGFAE